MAIASLILSIIAILVAGASAVYTRKQATEEAKVASIERDRRHDELNPEFKITCEAQGQDDNRAELTLELTGPAGLTELHQVTVRIRDDIPDRQPRFGSQLTQEQISAVIWGPYVRGHEKVPVCGQVGVPAGGQLVVPIPRSWCRPGV